MNVNTYLPDDLGARAKADELPLSQMLQNAVRRHYEEADVIAATLDGAQEFELPLTNDDGRPYTGRITGTQIAQDDDAMVFLLGDQRVLLYDAGEQKYWDVTRDPESLAGSLSEDAYVQAMLALGESPVIDL